MPHKKQQHTTESSSQSSSNDDVLCGIWVSDESVVNLAYRNASSSWEEEVFEFRPFLWSTDCPVGIDIPFGATELKGDAGFNYLLSFNNGRDWSALQKRDLADINIEAIKSFEEQYLLQHELRLFAGMEFSKLKRVQLDIETGCSVPGGFSKASRPGDRVLAIGVWFSGRPVPDFLVLKEDTDAAEKELLESLNDYLIETDPDVIEGHNIFKFDLDYLKQRCERLGVECRWGRFGQKATFRPSRFRIAERWLDFPRCDIPGRTVFDTYFMIQVYDLTSRQMRSYSLKEVAVHLGITNPEDKRTYLHAHEIQESFHTNRELFFAYLADDLRETRGLGDLLLPTYFAQIQNFPITLQEGELRGTAHKVDLMLLEKYYHADHALPIPEEVQSFEGGYTRSFEQGVFKHVLHFDVASLYPSLLLVMDQNPASDALGIFIPLLKELREYRLHYKNLAKKTTDDALRMEYEARQSSFKILINSFYGYLGFPGAHFADSKLAAELTLRGRELLQDIIQRLQDANCKVLEADTDGIYLTSEEHYEKPEKLLAQIQSGLPKGIDLEFDGRYPAMFSYKSKNYALYDGERVIIRGSALRSRGMEPFLKDLTYALIHYVLGVSKENPVDILESMRDSITAHEFPIEKLCKTEFLSQNPEAYQRAISMGEKGRRASLEVAVRMDPKPRMGEPVSYFIARSQEKRAPDWQRAQSVHEYNPKTLPYDENYYIEKLEDWKERYRDFLVGGKLRGQMSFEF